MGNKKIYIIGGIVLLVIAGVSIGAYFLVKKKNKESDKLKSNEKTTGTSPAETKNALQSKVRNLREIKTGKPQNKPVQKPEEKQIKL
jgi:flagellar basal body-associated protein FliL